MKTADKARADLKKIQDGHKCTQPTHWDEPNPCLMCIKDLEDKLAQAERERDDSTYGRLLKAARDERDATRAEVERLKGELNEAKEEVRRQVEVRVLDQGRHHVDLQEAPGQIVPESLCSCGETLRELEADHARTRAALEAALRMCRRLIDIAETTGNGKYLQQAEAFIDAALTEPTPPAVKPR